MRFQIENLRAVKKELIYKAIPNSKRSIHFGSRIIFDRENYLFFSIGDRGERDEAQDLDKPNGKIHRLHLDGRVPGDNPFKSKNGDVSTIWCYGNRNPQGLAFSKEGVLWESEHGPSGGDELNIIEPGKNYGWPAITYGIDYSGAKISPFTEMDGMEQPLKYWSPSIAPSGMVLYTGDAFPAWKNSFLISALVTKDVKRVYLDGNNYVEETLFSDIGLRIRNIHQTADGNLILLSDGPDGKIILVSPDND